MNLKNREQVGKLSIKLVMYDLDRNEKKKKFKDQIDPKGIHRTFFFLFHPGLLMSGNFL